MDITSLFSDKKQAIGALLDNLNLSPQEVTKTIESTEEVVVGALTKETSKNGLSTALNLFSSNNNSTASNQLLKNLDSDLIKKLISNGFNKQKAGSIKDKIVPFVVKLLASKIGGKSDILGSLLGGVLPDASKSQNNLLGKLFK
jgi:endonuclease III-like uncharacterized protein